MRGVPASPFHLRRRLRGFLKNQNYNSTTEPQKIWNLNGGEIAAPVPRLNQKAMWTRWVESAMAPGHELHRSATPRANQSMENLFLLSEKFDVSFVKSMFNPDTIYRESKEGLHDLLSRPTSPAKASWNQCESIFSWPATEIDRHYVYRSNEGCQCYSCHGLHLRPIPQECEPHVHWSESQRFQQAAAFPNLRLSRKNLHDQRLARGFHSTCHLSVSKGQSSVEKTAAGSHAEMSKAPAVKKAGSLGGQVETSEAMAWWKNPEVVNWANAISTARLLAGPGIGMSRISSVLGSYLDPLADKVLIASVTIAMMAKGLLPVWLVSLVVARDCALLLGAFAHRARMLSWQWKGWTAFFHTGAGGAERMEPLFISKVNTVAQLALGAAALIQPAMGGGGPIQLVPVLIYTVAGTTVASWIAYLVIYLRRPTL